MRRVDIFLSLSLFQLLYSSLPPPPSLLPSVFPSFYTSLSSFTLLSLTISSPAPPSFCLPRSLPVFFLLLSTCLLCALPVSQRIPLVAQLRDSAGKLRLFKARSAGKASSCWKEAAWTRRTSPNVYTLAHINTDTHTRLILKAQCFYYHVSLHFKPDRCHSM